MSQVDRRQALRMLAALGAGGVLAPTLAGCTGEGAASDENESVVLRDGPPLKIGMIVPQSGPAKPLGDEMANGFALYTKINGDQFAGRKVQLVNADEGETPQSGIAGATRLLKQDRVDVLTGVVSPAVMLGIRDLVESSQVPLIGSNASPAALQGAKYIWRTSFVGSEPSLALGRWVADHVSGPVAVMAADYPGDREEVRSFVQALQDARGTVAGEPIYTPVGGSPAGSFARVRSLGAQALFAFYTGTAAIEFTRAFKAAAFPPAFRVFAPGALTEGFVLKQQGETARGIFTAMNYSPDLDNASNRRFVAQYQRAYGTTPSTYAMASYDAAAVIERAAVAAGADRSPVALNAAVGRLGQIESPRGSWQFNQTRTPVQRWYLRQVRPDGTVLSNVLTAELTTLG